MWREARKENHSGIVYWERPIPKEPEMEMWMVKLMVGD
jgi:hypothetical protein